MANKILDPSLRWDDNGGSRDDSGDNRDNRDNREESKNKTGKASLQIRKETSPLIDENYSLYTK